MKELRIFIAIILTVGGNVAMWGLIGNNPAWLIATVVTWTGIIWLLGEALL
jgi:hypothetical protein